LSGLNPFSRAAKVNEFYTNPDSKVIFSDNSANNDRKPVSGTPFQEFPLVPFLQL
jgi:hypothetical protein